MSRGGRRAVTRGQRGGGHNFGAKDLDRGGAPVIASYPSCFALQRSFSFFFVSSVLEDVSAHNTCGRLRQRCLRVRACAAMGNVCVPARRSLMEEDSLGSAASSIITQVSDGVRTCFSFSERASLRKRERFTNEGGSAFYGERRMFAFAELCAPWSGSPYFFRRFHGALPRKRAEAGLDVK